jgi:TRAP-type mannitol/chloroaromatic compound transport system substrate-binding protein
MRKQGGMVQRRDFIKGMGAGSVAVGAAVGGLSAAQAQAAYKWKMVTTWPKHFPGLGTGANDLADLIGELSGGRIEIKVYGAGELAPPLEVFTAVARGRAEIGHGCAACWSDSGWKDQGKSAPFFSNVPFGMTAQELNGWLYRGGGMELWVESYARFGLVPAPVGNTGMQMGGWFNKEIRTVEDLKGIRMCIPGVGAEVLARVGGTPVTLAGGALLAALQAGDIDAAEWVGPYTDLALGLYTAAKYYYYPGWHAPGAVIEAVINKRAFDALPADLQAIVMNACKGVNQDVLAEFTARNPAALTTLRTKHKVEMRRFPDEVLRTLRARSDEVVAGLAQQDEFAAKVFASLKKFLSQTREWSILGERAYLQARDQL